MADQLETIAEQIEARELAALSRWRELSRVTPGAIEAFRVAEDAASKAKMAARTAAVLAERYAKDDTLYPAGRDRLVREALAKGKADARRELQRLEGATAVIAAEVRHAMMPSLDRSREMAARDELKLLTESAGSDIVPILREAAERDRDLAAVICSSYGESLLRARGVAAPKDAHALLQQAAMAAAAQSTDSRVRSAAAAHTELSAVETLPAVVRHTVETALSAAESAGVDV